MIYKHIRTGILYSAIGRAFSVELQKPTIIYISQETGEIFSREDGAFMSNFEHHSDPQANIKPKEPK